MERAFRCLKGIDILVRPIRHRDEQRVKAHLFLCMLAYYVEWHMRRALARFFDDEQLDQDRKTRDPVAAAKPSASAKKKKALRVTTEGLPIHSFNSVGRTRHALPQPLPNQVRSQKPHALSPYRTDTPATTSLRTATTVASNGKFAFLKPHLKSIR